MNLNIYNLTHEKHQGYMQAPEQASAKQNIVPITELLAEFVEKTLDELAFSPHQTGRGSRGTAKMKRQIDGFQMVIWAMVNA